MRRAPKLSEADVLAVLPSDRAVSVAEVAAAVRRRLPAARGVLIRLARLGLAEQVPVPLCSGRVARLDYRRKGDR